MKTLIVADTHFASHRVGGTTKQSRKALEDWMLEQFYILLDNSGHTVLIILGDLFDKRNVDEHIMKQVINTLRREHSCIIIAGNHDLGGIEDYTLSSAEFVASMSGAQWIDKPAQLSDNLYAVPHLHNQDAFDRAIQKVPDGSILLIHANIDSPFAHSDHSLNLSKEQIADLAKREVEIISGHEHTGREYMDNVFVIGNLHPSSIADCMGGPKRALLLDGDEIEILPTWDVTDYVETDWRTKAPADAPFISITGTCSPEEYPGILRQVAELRKNYGAFIIRNAVEVETLQIELGKEEVTEFNVTEMFLEQLPPKVRKKVEEVL